MALTQVDFDYAQSAIIKPPALSNNNISHKTLTLVVDSRDREVEFYPNPNKYHVNLDECIEDVLSMELVQAHIPITHYLINKTNAVFHLKAFGNVYRIELEHGDYNAEQLSHTLKEAINKKDVRFQFDVVYYDIQNKFIFLNDVEFSLDFDATTHTPHNMHKILGFLPTVYESRSIQNKHELRAPFRANLRKELSYLLLHITGMYVNKGMNNNVEKSFAIIPRNNDMEKDMFIIRRSEEHALKKNFNPPFKKLAKLQLKFVDRNGDLYDFQNQDHLLVFKITIAKQPMRYASFADM